MHFFLIKHFDFTIKRAVQRWCQSDPSLHVGVLSICSTTELMATTRARERELQLALAWTTSWCATTFSCLSTNLQHLIRPSNLGVWKVPRESIGRSLQGAELTSFFKRWTTWLQSEPKSMSWTCICIATLETNSDPEQLVVLWELSRQLRLLVHSSLILQILICNKFHLQHIGKFSICSVVVIGHQFYRILATSILVKRQREQNMVVILWLRVSSRRQW
jgi:hypothetical protein